MKNIFKKYKEIIIAIIIILAIIIFKITKTINFNTNKDFLNTDSIKIENDVENDGKTDGETETKVNLSEEILKIEKEYSMKNGDRFVKIGNTMVYVDFDKDIYLVNLENKTSQILCKLEDGVQHVYFDGEYIYCMPYYYMGKGIYKIDLSGNIEKIYSGASLQLWLTNEEIYFIDQIGFDDINQIPQGNLCKMDKNR